MVNTFFADPAVGGDGSTTTDDANPTTGLDNGGHVTRLVPMFTNLINIANNIKALFTSATTLVNTVLNSAGTSATSVTTMTPAVASKSFTLAQTGKAFSLGQFVMVYAGTDNWFAGNITAFVSGTGAMTVNATTIGASPSPASSWTVSLTAFGGVSAARQVVGGGLATGGGDLSADRTITVTAASKAEMKAQTSTSKIVTPDMLAKQQQIDTLTDAATIAWDMATKGPNVTVTMGATGRTFDTPTNPQEGITYSIGVFQDATGSRVPAALPACFDMGALGAPTFSTGANKKDFLFMYCYDAATPLFRTTFSKAA